MIGIGKNKQPFSRMKATTLVRQAKKAIKIASNWNISNFEIDILVNEQRINKKTDIEVSHTFSYHLSTPTIHSSVSYFSQRA